MGEKPEKFAPGTILDKKGHVMHVPKKIILNQKNINGTVDRVIKENKKLAKKQEIEFPSIIEIITRLDEYVWGHTQAKQTLAVALKTLENRICYSDIELPKSNILMFGDTGCGKTYLVETLARIVNVPFLSIKMPGLSTQGYVGDSIEDAFDKLIDYENVDKDEIMDVMYGCCNSSDTPQIFKENAEFSIVYLDEIDKIAKPAVSGGDFSGGLQNELISYVENSMVLGNKLSTKNMLFIGTGAFIGLDKEVKNRLNKSSSIGFGSSQRKEYDSDELISQVTPDDFINYGFKPELVGRFPINTGINTLSEDDFLNILDMETSYLSKQKQILSQAYGIELKINKKAKEEIAKYSKSASTNARAIQSAVDRILKPIYLQAENIKGTKVSISVKTVKNRLYN